MKHIKIINSLILTSEGVAAKHKNGKIHDFFIKQGDLDGACAPYSTSMILMLLGLIKRSDLDVYKVHDKRTKLGKIIDLFFNQKGLIRNGYYFEDLVNELQVFKKECDIQYHDTTKDILEIIQNQIEIENPVLISVEYSGGAHALVAVGLEYNEDGKVSKMLCLDPGFEKPSLTYWNSVIDVEIEYKGKYKFTWLNDDSPVKFSDIVIFNKK